MLTRATLCSAAPGTRIAPAPPSPPTMLRERRCKPPASSRQAGNTPASNGTRRKSLYGLLMKPSPPTMLREALRCARPYKDHPASACLSGTASGLFSELRLRRSSRLWASTQRSTLSQPASCTTAKRHTRGMRARRRHCVILRSSTLRRRARSRWPKSFLSTQIAAACGLSEIPTKTLIRCPQIGSRTQPSAPSYTCTQSLRA